MIPIEIIKKILKSNKNKNSLVTLRSTYSSLFATSLQFWFIYAKVVPPPPIQSCIYIRQNNIYVATQISSDQTKEYLFTKAAEFYVHICAR